MEYDVKKVWEGSQKTSRFNLSVLLRIESFIRVWQPKGWIKTIILLLAPYSNNQLTLQQCKRILSAAFRYIKKSQCKLWSYFMYDSRMLRGINSVE